MIHYFSRWSAYSLVVSCIAIASFGTASHVRADLLFSGGAVIMEIQEGVAAPIKTFDAYFNENTSRTNALSLPSPGNASFSRAASVITLSDPIRASGAGFLSGDGRTRQATTFSIENSGDVLGSWGASSNDGGFIGATQLGEQIAFTSMQRYTGAFPGALIYGDFALRKTADNRLFLTSNIDFIHAAFAELGSYSVSLTGSQLKITGDLLVGGGLALLDPLALVGTKFGTFDMTATVTAVPEPSSLLLLGISGLAVGAVRRRRTRKRSVEVT